MDYLRGRATCTVRTSPLSARKGEGLRALVEWAAQSFTEVGNAGRF
jgi:hypothetical protein